MDILFYYLIRIVITFIKKTPDLYLLANIFLRNMIFNRLCGSLQGYDCEFLL